MNRIILSIVLMLVFENVFSQQIITVADENSVPFVINDTLFIKKDSVYSIFIDTAKNSAYYRKLTDFSIKGYSKENYTKATKHKLDKFPRKWRELFLYNGEYYVYYPCDFCSNYRISITDKTIIDYWCDGAYASQILNYKSLNNNTFYFHTLERGDRKLTIYLIDKLRGIAIFKKEYSVSGETGYDLMVDVEKIKEFPIIVNKCDEKLIEMNFQTPDFETLIKNK
jgi:hypothetical protein